MTRMILIEGVHTHADTTTNEYALENDNYGEGDTPIYTWLATPGLISTYDVYGISKKDYALVETCYGLKIVKIKSVKVIKNTDLKEITLQHGMDLKYAIAVFDDEFINSKNPRMDWGDE